MASPTGPALAAPAPAKPQEANPQNAQPKIMTAEQEKFLKDLHPKVAKGCPACGAG